MRNFFTFLLFLVFVSCNSIAQEARSTTFDNREVCEKSKGVWRQFGNGCASSCNSKFERFKVCTMAITYSCECGNDKCWDGENNKCVLLNDYKVVFDKEQKDIQDKLDEMKDARKEQAKQNVEKIVNNLIKNYRKNQTVDNSGSNSSNQSNSSQGNVSQFYDEKSRYNIIENNSDMKQSIGEQFQNQKIEATKEVNENQKKFEIPASYLQKLQQIQESEQKNLKEEISKLNDNTEVKDKKNTYKSLDEGLPQIPLPN